MERRERADAARNRAAILRAAEDLITEHGAEHVSVELVARTAGVGKGTVFHRFGSRSGLMRALIEDRVSALEESFTSGPPPLGPGAPARDRLIAFFDAVLTLATRNVALIAAYEQAADGERQVHPVYRTWHQHVSGLIAQCRQDVDADLLAHILLGALHTDLVRHLIKRGETARLAATVRQLVTSVAT